MTKNKFNQVRVSFSTKTLATLKKDAEKLDMTVPNFVKLTIMMNLNQNSKA